VRFSQWPVDVDELLAPKESLCYEFHRLRLRHAIIDAMLKKAPGIHGKLRAHLEVSPMPEPLPEHQKTQLIVRSPLSTEGFVSIYFSSPEGRLMSEEEWWNLKQLIELTNRVCVKQQARAQSA
jgi:hypothetical protein